MGESVSCRKSRLIVVVVERDVSLAEDMLQASNSPATFLEPRGSQCAGGGESAAHGRYSCWAGFGISSESEMGNGNKRHPSDVKDGTFPWRA